MNLPVVKGLLTAQSRLCKLLIRNNKMFQITLSFFNTTKLLSMNCKDRQELIHDLKYVATVQDLKSITIEEI